MIIYRRLQMAISKRSQWYPNDKEFLLPRAINAILLIKKEVPPAYQITVSVQLPRRIDLQS